MFKKFQYKIFTHKNIVSVAQWSVELRLKQTAQVRILIMTDFFKS